MQLIKQVLPKFVNPLKPILLPDFIRRRFELQEKMNKLYSI